MAHSMKAEARLLYIMERLSQEALSNTELAREIYGENNDTTRANIRNSIKALKKHFGERLMRVSRGRHRLIDLPHIFTQVNSSSTQEMLGLFEFVSLFDSNKLALFEQSEPELVQRVKRETAQIYHLFDPPYEKIIPAEHWQQIKKAIRGKRYLSAVYEKNKPREYHRLKPIRIVYAQNNWYLAALLTQERDGYDFTFLRINNIKKLTVEKTTFHVEIKAGRHLEKMQSLFEDYDVLPYEVLLSIPADIASYFRHKKFLSSQHIIEERPDGTLLISYQINNDMMILPLIKQWMPYIDIVKPESLKTKVMALCQAYLERHDS